MYAVRDFGMMMRDKIRMKAYVEALKNAVEPGMVVLDLGTGAGVFAMLACRFGAKHVYAIEPLDVIDVARQAAQASGYADRITFIQDLSTRVTLPEKADVMIYDLHGVLPFFYQHIPSVVDARARHLNPGATLIPQKDHIWIAPVEAFDLFQDCMDPWIENDYDLNYKSGHRIVTSIWRRGRVEKEQFLAEPQHWFTLDYNTITNPNGVGKLNWIAPRPATIHGYQIWFDTDVAEGITLTNAPYAPKLVYGTAFFPLEYPIEVQAGDYVELGFFLPDM